MLTIGRTNYTITKQADDMFTAENNRSTKILVPFADNKDKFYGFNFGSGHKNIKNQDGTWWTITRAELVTVAA